MSGLAKGLNFANLFRNEEDPLVLEDGHRVIEEGGKSELMYVVLEGAVEIQVHGKVVETVEAGGVFGEMSMIDDKPGSATVVVKGGATLAKVDERRFLFLVQQHPTFAVELMRVMSSRLRHMEEES